MGKKWEIVEVENLSGIDHMLGDATPKVTVRSGDETKVVHVPSWQTDRLEDYVGEQIAEGFDED